MSIYHSIYSKVVKIKDNIHDYISLTSIELGIVETCIFQRLKNISQSGLIHTVYPSNKTSRFEHSLGCLHLSGLFIENMFSNSSVSKQMSVLENEKQLTVKDSFILELINCYENDFDKSELENYIDFLQMENKNFTRDQIIEALVWQSVRVCGLLHDIGHLPFSHDLEGIINENINLIELDNSDKVKYLRDYYNKYHEFATLKIISSEEIKNCFTNHTPVYNIMLKIFLSKINNKYKDPYGKFPKQKRDAYSTLRDIVDNEIDADRGDYLKRDGESSGVEMGDYDLTRLVENIEIIMNEKKEYYIRPTQYASSIVEQFLMERYRIYNYVHFHQKSVFVNTLLGRIVNILLSPSDYNVNINTSIDPLSLNYKRYVHSDEATKRYKEPFDDISIISVIRKAYGEIKYKESDKGLTKNEEFLKNIIEISFYRRKNYISLWKKNEDYMTLYKSKIQPEIESAIHYKSLNELSQKYLMDMSSIRSLEDTINKYIPEETNAKIIISPKHFQLIKDNYFIINTKSVPWTTINIKDFAPLLRHAKGIRQESVQMFCYAVLNWDPTNEEKIKLIPVLTDSFIKGIKDWFKNISL